MTIKSIKQKIKEYFFINPTSKLRVRQIERLLEVPLPSVIRYSKELEKESILKSINISGVNMYAADRASKKFLLQKKLFNIFRLYDSGLVEFIAEELGNPAIMIFGSYSKGEDAENSDIDIYIETHSKAKIDLKKFEKKLNRKIHAFYYKNIGAVENKELANNILNGIVLNGYIGVF